MNFQGLCLQSSITFMSIMAPHGFTCTPIVTNDHPTAAQGALGVVGDRPEITIFSQPMQPEK